MMEQAAQSSSRRPNATLTGAVHKAQAGQHLARAEAESVMEEILSGRADDAEIASLLVALRQKGESLEELVGFAQAMRRHAAPVFPGKSGVVRKTIVDTCGTGGDAKDTFNISTAAAFVAAGAGVRVAKHGNRSFSSKCGSADVLETLGVRLEVAPERAGEAIERIGIGFLFAPIVHTAMKHAAAARKQVGGRTVFNLLGPLTNPAGAIAQVVGVSDRRLTEPMGRALGELGCERAFVVHGADGLDEISLSGETYVTELANGSVRSHTLTPEDFGFERAPLAAFMGGDAQENARIIRRILHGEKGPRRDIAVANAAAAIVSAGRAGDFLEGVSLATQSIDSGAAQRKLDALAEFTSFHNPAG